MKKYLMKTRKEKSFMNYIVGGWNKNGIHDNTKLISGNELINTKIKP